MSLIEARHLEVGYPVAGAGLFGAARMLPIVRDCSLRLEAGRTLGVVGESGCGKSTLGRALLRLVVPMAGQVLWQGEDMAAMAPEALRRRRAEFQIIFQDPVAALDPRMTLGRIVSRNLATFQPGLSRGELAERAVEALRLVGLSADFAQRYPHELSGGQAQRVGIARAIIGGPKLVVCDEPVSALDVSIQAQVVNLLMDLQDQLGLALVFISHNLAVVRHISHEIMVPALCVAGIPARCGQWRGSADRSDRRRVAVVVDTGADCHREIRGVGHAGRQPRRGWHSVAGGARPTGPSTSAGMAFGHWRDRNLTFLRRRDDHPSNVGSLGG